MKVLHCLLSLIALVGIVSCSGGIGGSAGNALLGGDSNVSGPVIPASQVETAKLQEAIKANPAYKIDDSEIALLQREGVINESDIAQLQVIQ